ncbi:MAG: hypothetical protein HWE23_15040 [Rhodobacteraceae bacterium]|nr:hypothetical protein [Paracoccaceae bacterium]
MSIDLPKSVLSGILPESSRQDGSVVDLEVFKDLASTTDEGLRIDPLYNRLSGAAVQTSTRQSNPWHICQIIDIPDVVAASKQIHEDLGNGATSLELFFQSAISGNGRTGIRVDTLADMERLLFGIDLTDLPLRMCGGHETQLLFALILALFEKQGRVPADDQIHLLRDPVGWLGRNGYLRDNKDKLVLGIKETVAFCGELGANVRYLHANGALWHNAGAGQAEELACVMASVLEYFRIMETAGAAPETWAASIAVTLAAEEDQLGTIAKARAARRMWANLLDACQLDQVPLNLHMETSRRMLATYDVWNNVLRNTIAVFGASVGGADSISVRPHTSAFGLADVTARRIARNTQSVLLLESNLHKVIDPSAGSGAIESWTKQTQDLAWDILQQIEAIGGAFVALTSGMIQTRIKDTRQGRLDRFATREKIMIGVNEYTLLPQKAPSVIKQDPLELTQLEEPRDLPPNGNGARVKACVKALLQGAVMTELMERADGVPGMSAAAPLGNLRIAQGFEELQSQTSVAAETPDSSVLILKQPDADPEALKWLKSSLALSGVHVDAVSAEGALSKADVQDYKVICLVPPKTAADADLQEAISVLGSDGKAVYLAVSGDRECVGAKSIYPGSDVLALLTEIHRDLGLLGNGEDLS